MRCKLDFSTRPFKLGFFGTESLSRIKNFEIGSFSPEVHRVFRSIQFWHKIDERKKCIADSARPTFLKLGFDFIFSILYLLLLFYKIVDPDD